jgi:hypothetical protein
VLTRMRQVLIADNDCEAEKGLPETAGLEEQLFDDVRLKGSKDFAKLGFIGMDVEVDGP